MDNNSKINKTLTSKEIAQILDAGNFDVLVGQRESGVFEAKLKRPYDLPKRPAILEMTKDIASLANNKGGYIICGLITEKPANSPHDYVKGLDLVSKANFYEEPQVIGLVSSNIYPKIDIRIKWYPYKNDKTLGLGVIEISEQDESKKYFIVKVLEIEGDSTREYFGIPVRTDDDTKWVTVQELHKLSKRAPNNLQEFYLNLSSQIQELKGMIYVSTAAVVDIDSIPAKVEETIYGNE